MHNFEASNQIKIFEVSNQNFSNYQIKSSLKIITKNYPNPEYLTQKPVPTHCRNPLVTVDPQSKAPLCSTIDSVATPTE